MKLKIYKLIKELEQEKEDIKEIEKRIKEGFREKVQKNKGVRNEKGWTLSRWTRWHEKEQHRKNKALLKARSAVKTKNRVLDRTIKKLQELVK